jgi:hypothetical protein
MMNREDKCKLAIEKGIEYNPETGEVFGVRDKVIKGKIGSGYITIGLNLNDVIYNLLAHHFAWYITYGEVVEQIDHINGVRDDNRICNLRSVTQQENNWNRKKSKGYSFREKKNKWESGIKLNGKSIYLGSFDTEKDAHNAYLDAKKLYHNIDNPELNIEPPKIEVKGYCWNKLKRKYQSYILVNSKRIYLGYFDNEEDARQAYLEAKKKYHIIN